MALRQRHDVGASTEFPEGQIVARVISGRDLIFVRSSGKLWAFEDLCTHQPVKLSDFGEFQNGKIMCHAHGGLFDIDHGGTVLMPPPCDALHSFQCDEESGKVSVII